ncbi:hypothetical protein M406DRAFT_329155 [Cryphonectria parasitica EP155]|uniref:Uncharacterized protein n=1 Tax=Cryphonectria parasitica (strain ATCC 38755 / EP155) TaxID=660469 RepID=A0A9P4Y856_CRYP1|nr:uncharacterized protein M406DRAFT_329155 [Cryphonectria parasitica EP155]KAF3768117.1 hypothetical protein M406DRAFT_329155 [Cryphonectria parasitica EP155]
MLGFHSLDPVKLLPGTSSRKTTISRPKHTAAEGTQKTLTNGSVNYHGNNSNLSERDAGPEKTIVPKQETTHESGGYKADGHVATSRHLSDQAKAYTELGLRNEAEAGTASIGWTIRPVKSNPPRPEPPRRSCSSSSLGHDTICIPSRPDESHIEAASTSRPDESSYNMIPYRRDAKLVIAYLVPLPQPNVQSQDGVIPPRYFLYVPPPPHLMKPKRGEEDQVHKLKRLHQQNERRAEPRISNGKWVTARGIHGRMTRTAVRFLDTLKDDNITFLSRVHPRTVRHLVLIHPQDSKKKAMRNSIISAAAFLPMLAINTAAMFFAGQAEFASIGLLLSVGAYQVARLVTTKLGPDPKMVDITQEELIDDAQQILGKISKPQQEKERTRLNMDQNSSSTKEEKDTSRTPPKRQNRDIKNDLRNVAMKAAKSWNEHCRRYTRRPRKLQKKNVSRSHDAGFKIEKATKIAVSEERLAPVRTQVHQKQASKTKRKGLHDGFSNSPVKTTALNRVCFFKATQNKKQNMTNANEETRPQAERTRRSGTMHQYLSRGTSAARRSLKTWSDALREQVKAPMRNRNLSEKNAHAAKTTCHEPMTGAEGSTGINNGTAKGNDSKRRRLWTIFPPCIVAVMGRATSKKDNTTEGIQA